MKTLIVINCVVAIITFILTLEIAEYTATIFKIDHPNVKLNKVTIKTKIISNIAIIIKVLIPIYNILILYGVLFMREDLIIQGYETLMNRIVEDE